MLANRRVMRKHGANLESNFNAVFVCFLRYLILIPHQVILATMSLL